MSFLFLNFREQFLQFCLSEIKLKYLHKILFLDIPYMFTFCIIDICIIGQIHLPHLQIHKNLMDDTSVTFDDMIFLHFLQFFFAKYEEKTHVMEGYGYVIRRVTYGSISEADEFSHIMILSRYFQMSKSILCQIYFLLRRHTKILFV